MSIYKNNTKDDIKMTKIGLLVMAYGTPYQESDIEAYYTDIRHGKNQLKLSCKT